jgi:ABC-2 type transport system ATP-binding protein
MTPVINAQKVSKWFGEVVAVNNLNVTVEPGVTGLLGPNGAGKTTFIKLCLGLYAPSRGTIEIRGESATAPKPKSSTKT